MDNENKEIDLETRNADPVSPDEEIEFDPTESEDFYSNLEAAIGFGDEPEETDVPELLTEEDLFGNVTEVAKQGEQTAVQEEDLFAGVDAALAEQIEQEFGKEEDGSAKEAKTNKLANVWKIIPTWTKILVSVILVVLLSVGLLFGTSGGRNLVYQMIVKFAFKVITVDPTATPTPEGTLTVTPVPTMDPNATPNPDATSKPENPDLTPTVTETPAPDQLLMDDERVINVLLLGEENMKGATRGRTDAIILVSINLDGGPLKMISFQRDLWVEIPGRQDDRLNAAYTYGDAPLAVATIEKNFGIDVDSYVKVGFDGFEDIIDKLGGLRISLTARESEYLNTTKYISKPEQRNTIAGYQTMTGSQVLGYCRVRYVPTADGLKNDIGRNYRHRVVLKAIFEQCKNKSLGELLSIMGQCFDYVSVDANLEQLAADCLSAVIEKKMFEIDTMQMPRNGENKNITVSGKEVVSFWPDDVDALQKFLYGE